MRRTKLAASTFTALVMGAGCDQLSQPENFDDCILKHMGGGDRAAVLIKESCREKFPDTRRDDDPELTDPERSKLITGRLGVFGGQYGGSMYNGNTDITVTSITIKVTATLGDNATAREYRHEVTIPSLTTRHFGVDIVFGDEGTEYSSDITSARGYRK